MTWQAILGDVSDATGTWSYTLIFTDGVSQKLERTYTADNIDDATIEASARAEIARINTVAASVGKLSYTVGASVNLTPPAPKVAQPSAEDVARNQFLTDYRAFTALNRAVAARLVAPDDPRLVALQKTLQTEWQDSYLPFV